MAMINYADKVALNSNSGIADINKCNATDMNEIKNAFNNQVAFGWYQTGVSPTFTFVSYDSTTKTGVVNSNLDLTSYLSVGMKIKFTQSSAIKYAFITAITSTQLTLFLGTDYSLNNSGISNSYYSMLKAPFGFPLNPDKWSVIVTNNTNKEISNPTKDTWYDSGLSISVPIGLWKLETAYSLVALKATSPVAAFGTLSSTLAETIPSITTVAYVVGTGLELFYKNSTIVNFSSKVTLKLITKTSWSSMTTIGFAGANKTIELRAVCGYL